MKFKIPKYLRPETQAWIRDVSKRNNFESHDFKLLEMSGETWDTWQKAREELEANGGLTFKDRFGQIRPHPALGVLRDSKIVFARLLRELGLDYEEPEDPRPPRLY